MVIAATGVGAESARAQTASLNFTKIIFAEVKGGPIGGLVVAGKLKGKERAGVYVTLHGLPPIKGDSDRFLVTADRRPCSQAAGDADADGDVDGSDFLVFKLGIMMPSTLGDVGEQVRLRHSLGSAKSVRIYAWPGRLVQKACGRALG